MWPTNAARHDSELVRRVRSVKRPLTRFGGATCPPLVLTEFRNLADSIIDAITEVDGLLTLNGLALDAAPAAVAPDAASDAVMAASL